MKRAVLGIGAVAAMVALGFGCGGGEPPRTAHVATTGATPGAAQTPNHTADHLCPMAVPGTHVRTVDVVGGVALELTTDATPVDVTELRRRVVTMAQRGGMGRMTGPAGGRGGRGAMHGAAPMPATEVRVEQVPRGERVTLLARDPKQVETLRARARAHASKMSGGACERVGAPKPPAPAPSTREERTPEGEI